MLDWSMTLLQLNEKRREREKEREKDKEKEKEGGIEIYFVSKNSVTKTFFSKKIF